MGDVVLLCQAGCGERAARIVQVGGHGLFAVRFEDDPAGGGVPPPPTTPARVSIACRAVKIASPVAVRSASCRWSRALSVAVWSVIGETNIDAVPANASSPRLMPGVRLSANVFAPAWAAARREGGTSVARIDSDTSIARITVARLRGTRVCANGPAMATVSSSSPRQKQCRWDVPRPLGPGGSDGLE